MKLDDFNSTVNSAKVSKVLEDKFGTRVDLNKLNLTQLQSLKARVSEAHKRTVKSMPFNSGHRNPEYLEQVALLEAIELKINEVDQVDEVAPKGWEGTVKAMKKHKEIDNPWALANYMKKKGMKSHVDEEVKDEEMNAAQHHDKALKSFTGSQTSALLRLVGTKNIANAKRAIKLAAEGKPIPGNLVMGFRPIVDIVLDILQGGTSYVRRLQTLDKQAAHAAHLDESKSYKVMVRHGKTKDSKDHMAINVKATDNENASAKAMEIAKKKNLKYPKVSSIEQLDESRHLFEGETEKAQLIMAVKDMVDRVQGMVEDLNKMKVEDLVALTDKMRDEFGQDQATSFTSGANDILSTGIDALTNARSELDNAVLALTGEAPAAMPGAEMPAAMPGAEMPAAPGAEMGAELPAEPGAELPPPEGEEEVGRGLRESKIRAKRRVLESSRFLGKLAK